MAFGALAFATWDAARYGGRYAQVMSFAGAMLVAAGWMVTNEVAIRNSRRQHTITLISDYMIRRERLEDKRTIRRYVPKSNISVSTVGGFSYADETHELAIAIDRELNFFEFVAVGLENGDLDPKISYETIRGILCPFIKQVRPYIDHWQTLDSEIWEHATALADRWDE